MLLLDQPAKNTPIGAIPKIAIIYKIDNSGFVAVVPRWLYVDSNRFSGEVLSEPAVSDVEIIIDTRLIVEFYSR